MNTNLIITSFLCLCICEQLCWAAFYPIRQYGGNTATYTTTYTPMQRNTIRKENIPDWVQLYKKLENRHENTKRRNPWSFQRTRGVDYFSPQRDLRTSLAGKSPTNNVMKPRDDLLLPRQPMMNYFYDKKQQRTPKQQLNIARLSYPSLNSMMQGSTLPSLIQHFKNSNFLRQQTSQSQTQLKKQSSINGNLDKKSVIRGVVPYTTYYNTYRPVQTTWYTPYQQQYMRSLIPAGFTSPLNSYYNNQLYSTRMNSNPSSLYLKSYITNDMKLSVKKAFIPRSNIQALSMPKERIPLTKPIMTKEFSTASSSKNDIHNKSPLKKSEHASVPINNSMRKNKTFNLISPPTKGTNVISVAQKRAHGTIHNGTSQQTPAVRTTNITLTKFPSIKTVNIITSQRTKIVGKHETTTKPSDAHYILSKNNRTHYRRHLFHKTENTKSANKRGFLSSPEEFEDEVGEFPIEEDPKTEITSEGIDSLNTLDQDQGELQQPGFEGTEGQPTTSSSLQETSIQQQQQEETLSRDQTGSLSLPLENEDGEVAQQQPEQQLDIQSSLAQQPAAEQKQQQQNTISGAQEVPLLNIETPDQNGVPEFLKNQMNEVSEHKLSSEFASPQKLSSNMMEEPSQPSAISQSQTNEPPSSDIPAGSTDIQNAKNDIMNLQQKNPKVSSKASLANSDEEAEALKEEKEANKLISNKEQESTPKIQDRPDIIGLGSNGMPSNVDKNTMNLHTGNLASSPESGMDINQQQSFNMDHLRDMDKIHEELRDDEGLETKSMMRKETNNPTSNSPFDSSPDAEATIAKLQQHDDLVSDKIIKSLSTLKEPPESVNLGGGESRKLIRNGLEEEGSEDEERGTSFQHQPSNNNNQESILDPVKAQERAEQLKEKLEREKELQNAVDRSEKETHRVALKTEDALNALDGKPLAKIDSVESSSELKLSTDKKVESYAKPTETEIKHEEIKKQEAPVVEEKKETTNEKSNGDEKTIITANQIQSPKKNSTNDKPTEQSPIKVPANDTQSQTKNEVIVPPQKDKIIAENATVSTQVVDVLKGMGQIKESAPKIVLNKTLDNEEKETKEAVSDLNVAIGILEKKLSLINQAKSTGDKKSIYLVDGENKKQDKDDVAAASRSQIELDNSLKLLEKVMSVAKKVGKTKQKSKVATVPPPPNQSEKKITNVQRSHIQPSINRQQQQPITLDVQEDARYFPSQRFFQKPSELEEYDLLEDESNKRDSIYRYPIVGDSFIVPVKRNKIPAFKSRNSQKQTYARSYTGYYNNKNNNNWNYRKSTLTRPFYPYSNYNRQFYYYQQPWSQYPRY